MRALLIHIIVIVILYGCDSGNVRSPSDQGPAPDARASELLSNGDYALAASEFLRLAEIHKDDTARYQLAAARAYIQDHNYGQADTIINSLKMTRADNALLAFRNVLLAKIALAAQQPEQAESLLNIDIPQDATTQLMSDWYATRADLFAMQNRILDAVNARIMLGNYLETPAAIEENTILIWDNLNRIALNELTRTSNTTNNQLRSWIELAAISKTLMARKGDLEKAINTWATAYPQHPANPLITSRMLAASAGFHTLPAHIALLLPFSGVYESYSEIIRDGFLAAWFNEKTWKPVVRIYNTDASSINEVYQTAVKNGADFIVGPLEKEAVRTLAAIQAMPVRTLALNQTDSSAASLPAVTRVQPAGLPDMIQFGLPPEDEAREVARRGILEGFARVLIITPTDDFGTRVYNAFNDEWTRLGGRVLEKINYEPRTDDFIAPVKQLLNIDISEARIAQLRQRLGRNLNVTSRLRKDADFIFMVATNQTARQIVPHLRFFRADTIPIYTISSVYNGKPDPNTDVDLNGVEFVDMPWLLNSKADIRSQIMRSWQSANMTFPRYFAFGIDAFRLIPELGQLTLDKNARFVGETGKLYITDDGIIRRNLVWAIFVDGQPQPIETGKLQ
jgi:uncharacterized protein